MQLVPLAIGVGLAFLAGYLQSRKQGKNKEVFQDDSPVNLSTRGTYVPVVYGRARVGAVITWLGNRLAFQEVVGRTGGKGSKKRKIFQTVFYEGGMHVLAIGPVAILHRILANGVEIFTGPISPASHPSGSTLQSTRGPFQIYWGEPDQPINTFLGDPGQNPSQFGIQSRWPLFCYVVWNNMRLGTRAFWPNMTYEIETELQTTGLVRSSGNVSAPGEGTGTIFNITGTYKQGGPGLDDRYTIPGYNANSLPAGGYVQLTGNDNAPDGIYLIGDSENILINNAAVTGIKLLGLLGQTNTPPEPTSATGSIELISSVAGLNPAHVIYQILFGSFPYGLGQDPNDFDINSLENLGTIMQNEGVRSSFVLFDGQSFLALLGAILQDLGCLLPFDVNTGLFKFQLVRPSSNVPAIPQNMLLDFPEFQTFHKPIPLNRLVFTYRDQDRQFREMTVTLDDDGQADAVGYANSDKIDIVSAIDYSTASRIAERRSQEQLAGSNIVTLRMNREARRLIPGRIFSVDSIADELICVTVQTDLLTAAVRVEAIPNYYAAADVTPDIDNQGSGQANQSGVPGPDILVNWLEISALLLNGEAPTIVVPRVRGSTAIVGTQLHISRDNVTYQLENEQATAQPGGTLLDAIPIDSFAIEEIGPSFTAQGPDIGSALDLSGDITNWRAGLQKAIIGDEIFFVRNIEALGGDTYRLRGLIRARYDTVREAHPVGASVILFQDDDLEPIQDAILEPGFPLYVKSQPISTTTIPLDQVNPILKTLQGKGIVPMDPVNLKVQTGGVFVNTYKTGGSPEFGWAYRSGAILNTGAGLQSAGVPTGTSPVEGDFTLEFLTNPGGVVVFTASGITATSYVLNNATLQAVFGGEPAQFDVRLRNVNGGFQSNPVTITVELT